MLALGLLLLALAAPQADTGSIRVKTDVAAVQVFLDGQEVGQTPLTIPSVAPGKHQLSLIRAGYEDHMEEISVQAGATARVFVVMKRSQSALPPLPVQYRAYHQHASGGCRGTLIVNAGTVDFRSDDGKDVFHVAVPTIRSVARSMGSAPLIVGGLVELAISAKLGQKLLRPADVAACRIEAPGRGYGFWAYEQDSAEPAEKFVVDAVVSQKTKELYELIYQLWSDSLEKGKK